MVSLISGRFLNPDIILTACTIVGYILDHEPCLTCIGSSCMLVILDTKAYCRGRRAGNQLRMVTGTGTRKYHIRFNGIFGSCICSSGTCCRGISAGSIRFRCGWHLINNFQSFFVIGTYFLSFVGFYCVVVCSSTLHFFICVRCFGTAFHSFDFFPGTIFCLTHNIVAGSAFTLFPGNFNTFVYTYHLGKLRCF